MLKIVQKIGDGRIIVGGEMYLNEKSIRVVPPEKIITRDDVDHLEWIFARLCNHHDERINCDYMVRFKSIIGKLENKP